MLTGTVWGSIVTSSCGQCHEDRWSTPGIPVELTVGDVEPTTGTTGVALTLTAAVTVPSSLDTIIHEWGFGDGTQPQAPATVPHNGKVAATHTYDAAGTYSGYLIVTVGANPPITVNFDVVVTDPPEDPGDVWTVTLGAETFSVTFVDYSGSLVAVKETAGGDTSLGIGVEFGGVIFWMDIWMNVSGSWGVGNTYFANIDRDTGLMNGVAFGGAEGMASFSGERN